MFVHFGRFVQNDLGHFNFLGIAFGDIVDNGFAVTFDHLQRRPQVMGYIRDEITADNIQLPFVRHILQHNQDASCFLQIGLDRPESLLRYNAAGTN